MSGGPAGGTSRRRPRGPAVGRLAALAPEDRPREKLIGRGAAALTDEELVAVLLGTGRAGQPVLETARDLLRGTGLHGLLGDDPAIHLLRSRGVGAAKAARLVAAAEIARRLARAELDARPVVSGPEAAGDYLANALAAETREVMGGLLLDARNRVVHDAVVFRGSATFAAVSPQPLFRMAVLRGAVGIVLYHNHPSGDPSPSPEDRATTDRFVRVGRDLGIEVRDHVVVGRGRWFSFRREGLL